MYELKGLYAIADAQHIGTNQLIEKVKTVLDAGVKIIQYRDKINIHDKKTALANEIKLHTTKHQALFIINDDIELAKSCDAEGVHLGKDDASINSARKTLGEDKIIGASCYNDFENAKNAIQAGANYVAFGSMFNSPSKPLAKRANIDLLIRAKKELSVPVCAIGGINENNVNLLLETGVDMIAIISALFTSNQLHQTTQEYLSLLQQFDLTA